VILAGPVAWSGGTFHTQSPGLRHDRYRRWMDRALRVCGWSLKPEPVFAAFESIPAAAAPGGVLLMSPQGQPAASRICAVGPAITAS